MNEDDLYNHDVSRRLYSYVSPAGFLVHGPNASVIYFAPDLSLSAALTTLWSFQRK